MRRFFGLLTLSACACTSAFAISNHDLRNVHAKDSRVCLTLVNNSGQFRDFTIAGRNYELLPTEHLSIKAPAGTIVYANSVFGKYHRGDAYVQLTQDVNNTRISMK